MMRGSITTYCTPVIVTGLSDGAVPFGAGLVILSSGKVQVPDQAGQQFDGVAAVPEWYRPGLTEYDAGYPLSLLRKGRVWVYAETPVDPTKPVYLRHTANGTKTPGDFRTDDDGARADLIPRAKWAGGAIMPGMALLEINLP